MANGTGSLDPQLTGNVGLYYCCYRLSLLGWNVMPTARNARGVDIIAYSRDASRFVGVQVKALSKRNPVPLGTSLDKIMGDFWVIVNKVATPTPSAFILLPSEVRERAHRGETGACRTGCSPATMSRTRSAKHGSGSGTGASDACPSPKVCGQAQHGDLLRTGGAAAVLRPGGGEGLATHQAGPHGYLLVVLAEELGILPTTRGGENPAGLLRLGLHRRISGPCAASRSDGEPEA